MIGCSVLNCGKPARTRGWCSAHYERWRLHGDPLGSNPRPKPAQEFLAKAISYRADDCLIWPFVHNGQGYGQVYVAGRMRYAHRVVCEAAHGAPPDKKKDAAHSCGNGHLGCVNPRHLYWASRKTNAADTIRHGRTTAGEKNLHARLTACQVAAIREYAGSKTQNEIAREFGVTRQTINRVRCGRTWRASAVKYGRPSQSNARRSRQP